MQDTDKGQLQWAKQRATKRLKLEEDCNEAYSRDVGPSQASREGNV